MSIDESLRLFDALFSWRTLSFEMRHAWYVREGFNCAAKEAFYDDLISAHRGLTR